MIADDDPRIVSAILFFAAAERNFAGRWELVSADWRVKAASVIDTANMNDDLLSRPTEEPEKKQRSGNSSHCEFAPGDIIAGKTIVQRLGQGRFATVWETIDAGNRQAIKVFRIGSSNRPYYENEISIHSRLFPPVDGKVGGGDRSGHIMGWRDFFTHSTIVGGEPRDHPCIVFDLAGDHLGRLIRRQKDVGFPPSIVCRWTKDILAGLQELHSAGIIHTDIAPGNLLLTGDDIDTARIVISDLGSSCTVDNIWEKKVGTNGFIAPELVLGKKYTTAIDIWSAFVVCYELFTGDPLFDIYGDAQIDYGEDILADLIGFEISSDEDQSKSADRSERYSSDDDDSSGDEEDSADINYQHLLLIEKVLGPAPKEITSIGREFYNARGRLKFNPDIEHLPISELLYANYDLTREECAVAEEFFLRGLRWLAADRCTAADALLHPWLAGE